MKNFRIIVLLAMIVILWPARLIAQKDSSYYRLHDEMGINTSSLFLNLKNMNNELATYKQSTGLSNTSICYVGSFNWNLIYQKYSVGFDIGTGMDRNSSDLYNSSLGVTDFFLNFKYNLLKQSDISLSIIGGFGGEN